jgi:hypothetical protein
MYNLDPHIEIWIVQVCAFACASLATTAATTSIQLLYFKLDLPNRKIDPSNLAFDYFKLVCKLLKVNFSPDVHG